MTDKPFPDCYWADPGRLLAGQYPGHWDDALARVKLSELLKFGIETFVDMTESGEHGLKPYLPLLLEEAAKSGKAVNHVRVPIPDVSAGTEGAVRMVLEAIGKSLAEEKPVYVHCYGGHGRTGMVVGCYFVESGLSADDALARVAALHATTTKPDHPSPETGAQIRRVRAWKPRP